MKNLNRNGVTLIGCGFMGQASLQEWLAAAGLDVLGTDGSLKRLMLSIENSARCRSIELSEDH